MKITIAKRLHPFSHRPGTSCPLPLSTWQATIYPTRAIFQRIDDPSQEVTLDFSLQGPIKDFTVELDLEKAVIRVFGFTPQGYIRYEIARVSSGIQLRFDKVPKTPLTCTILGIAEAQQVTEKQTCLICIPAEKAQAVIPTERLSLGSHKAQDWDLVLRRFDLTEILPVLMRLGQMIPSDTFGHTPSALLDAFQAAAAMRNKLEMQKACEIWLRAHFTGILAPTVHDILFQGILSSQAVPSDASPLAHLTQGVHLIRSLFFQQTPSSWEILPCQLPLFHSGRMTDLTLENEEVLSFEWSKHQLKKVIVQTHAERTQTIQFPKEFRSLRLRKSLREKGKTLELTEARLELDLPANTQLFFDCFKK